jgi:hypothetical protein
MARTKLIYGFLYTMVDKFCCSSEHICGMMIDFDLNRFEADLKTYHIVQDALRIPRNTNLVHMVGENLQRILEEHFPNIEFESMRLFNTYGEDGTVSEGRLSCWIVLTAQSGKTWCAGLENGDYTVIGKRRRIIRNGGSRNLSSNTRLVAAIYTPDKKS